MSGISLNTLKQYARNDDLELREIGGTTGQIDTRQGSFVGRLIRNLKIKFGDEDRTVKKREYVGAKEVVLQALIENYGYDIGTKAFRAGVGRMVGSEHEISDDHPLTGRHVATMLRVAKELVGGSSQLNAWMDRVFGDEHKPGIYRVELGEPVSEPKGQMELGAAFESIVEDLERDSRRFLAPAEDDEERGLWLVRLETHDGRDHFCPLSMSRDDPGHVERLDSSGKPQRLSLPELGVWLRDLVGTSMTEGVKSVSLHRPQVTKLGDDVERQFFRNTVFDIQGIGTVNQLYDVDEEERRPRKDRQQQTD